MTFSLSKTSISPIRTVPTVGSRKEPNRDRRVVFPAPFLPSNPYNFPWRSFSETFLSASTSPYFTVTRCISMSKFTLDPSPFATGSNGSHPPPSSPSVPLPESSAGDSDRRTGPCAGGATRSEERRVGKECRRRWQRYDCERRDDSGGE